MSSKLAKANFNRALRARNFSAQAAHKAEGHGALAGQSLKQTKLPNGLVIAAFENYSPISRIGVFVRAGARFEGPGQLGLTHALRNAAGLSTQTSSNFGITRNLEFAGGSLTASTNREDLIYVLENNRDSAAANIRFLADTVTRPAFKPWELSDTSYRQEIDVLRLGQNPQAQLVEALHKAAFRGGLANSLYSSSFQVGRFDHNDLLSFVTDNFTVNRMAIVGLGVELGGLVAEVERSFVLNPSSAAKEEPSKFIGGDVRVETSSGLSYVAVVAEGAG